MSARLWSLPMSTLTVTGPDALAWLNGLVTQELGGAEAPRGVAEPSFFLTKQGKIRASLVVLREETERITVGIVNLDESSSSEKGSEAIGAFRTSAETLRQELDHYLVMEDAEIEVDTQARWFFGRARSEEREGFGDAVYAFPLLGPDAFWAVERGGPLSSRDVPRTGADWDALRVEFGLPWFGMDYASSDNPHEAGLERAYVSFSKGCYLGQEVVCMQEMRGKVKRRVVRLCAESAAPELRAGTPVTSEAGDAIGVITTAHGSRALAMLKAPHETPGSSVLALGARFRVSLLEPGTVWAV